MRLFIFSLPVLLSFSLFINDKLDFYSRESVLFEISDTTDDPSSNGLTDVANMFNERGYYKSNGFSLSEQEIINDFSGNLMYEIPLYNYKLAGDLGLNLSLNYNGSVGHQTFVGNASMYSEGLTERFSYNSAEWIVSLNGIAVQTLNYETSFFNDPIDSNQIWGNKIKSLIPGYHFDGSLLAAQVPYPYNRLLILAGDGSVISLVNTVPNSYDGNYISEGKGLYYKAKVSFYESGSNGYRKRIVKLMRGDGTMFIFREYKRNFYDFDTTAIVNARRKPMMLLLEEIKDNFGHSIKLWNHTQSTSSTDFFGKGRPFLDSITAKGYLPEDIKIKFIPTETGMGIQSQSLQDGEYLINYSQTQVSFNSSGNKKAYINQIRNPSLQKIEISNVNYGRTIRNIQNNLLNKGILFRMLFNNLKRIKYFKNYLNGSNSYVYSIGGNLTDTISVDAMGQINSRLRSGPPYYKGYGRDPFYTNMLGSKIDSNNSIPKSLTTFYYEYDDDNLFEDKIDSNDRYSTLKSVFSQSPNTDNNSYKEIRVYNEYRDYPIYNQFHNYLDVPDIQGITKLMFDSTYSLDHPQAFLDRNEYYYEVGSPESDGSFNGSFLIIFNQNKRNNLSRISTFKYKYENGPNSPITSKFQVDPLQNKDTMNFINLYRENLIHKKMSNSKNQISSQNSNDTTIFYKIQMPSEEKKFDQNLNLLSRKSYTYITTETDNAGYYGQLKNQKVFNSYAQAEFIMTEYEYYKNDSSGDSIYTEDFYPYKEGNIKLIKNPNGQETKFYYTPQTAAEVVLASGQNPKLKFLVKYNNGSVVEESEDIWDGRLPIRTDNCFNNGTSTIVLSTTYQTYSIDGSPEKLINESKFLTQINYEPVHRVKSIILPGDFTSNSSTFTIKYNYDNILNTINVLSYRNTVTPDFSKVKYSIDGFGNIKEKDIFVNNADSNAYLYKFNFMNKPARNFDALSDSTMFSYDGLGRSIRTKNADTSLTFTDYSYQSSLSNYFGGTYSGFIEKQYFTDELANHFEKYFDAVGNLLQEVKYESEIPSDGQTVIMRTNYKYDSLYRLTKVQTPGEDQEQVGKIIHYFYDGFGRQSKRITPDAGHNEYIYDKRSNLTYTQDENQKAVSSTTQKYTFRNYDALDRLTGVGEAFFEIDSPYDGVQYQPSTPDDYLTVNVYDALSSSIVSNLFTPPSDYDPGPNYTNGKLVSSAFRTRSSDIWSFKYYRYDERGRVIKLWNIIDGLGTKMITYEYNSQDQVTKMQYNTGDDYKRYVYRYDFAGRLDSVNYYLGDETSDMTSLYRNFTNYEYNPNSMIEFQNYKGTFLTNAYSYNNRNWVTQLYNSIDQFAYDLDYFKNGNIKSQYLYGSYRDYFVNSDELFFEYSYDRSNRLTDVNDEFTEDNTYLLENSYDLNGNILTLKRYGDNSGVEDNFAYDYNPGTNQLNNVSGAKDEFAYDFNGNLNDDKLNKNNDLLYDYRNLLLELYHTEGSPPARVTLFATRYFYDEGGNRIRKLIYSNFDETAGPVLKWNNLDNPGNGWFLYRNEFYVRSADGKVLASYNSSDLTEWYVYGNDLVGKIEGITGYYYYKDHLGSVRAVVNHNGELISAQDYDVWGYLLQNRSFDSDLTKFKFTGKERDEESQYDYFGARYYDARIGRWGQVEPLLDKYPSLSPYNYSLNNSLKFMDVDGLDVIVVLSGAGFYKAGKEISPSNYSPTSDIGAERLLYNLQTFSNENNIEDLDIRGYYSSIGIGEKNEIIDAGNFIINNLNNLDEKVILYGYSQGGANIVELANYLNEQGISVNVLFTVDAYDALSESSGFTIPENTRENYNYFQISPDAWTGARGTVNRPSGSKTKVRNKIQDNSSHNSIDEDTSEDILRIIYNKIE